MDAIFSEDELPEDQQEFLELNRELAETWENITEKQDPLPDAEAEKLFAENAENTRKMLAGLPRARRTTLQACGHVPPNECPVQLRKVLAEVLAMEPPGPVRPDDPDTEGEAQEENGA